MNTDTWVLIADSSRARLYSVPQRGKPWTLVNEYSHSESRVSQGGLTTDQPGRSHGSGIGKGARSAMESKSSPKEVEVAHFVHELVEVLHHGHGQQAYERIVLVAPPHFLGLLRKGLNNTVSKLVGASVDKDYLHLPEPEMQAHLDALLQAADGVAKPDE
ncbi:MAG: host attachment protein [Pseudomonadota bacterium]